MMNLRSSYVKTYDHKGVGKVMKKVVGISTALIVALYAFVLRGNNEWQFIPDLLAGLALLVVIARNYLAWKQ